MNAYQSKEYLKSSIEKVFMCCQSKRFLVDFQEHVYVKEVEEALTAVDR